MTVAACIHHRLLVSWVVGVGLLLGAQEHVAAGDPADSVWDGLAQVPATELAQWRGGWTDANGAMVRFGFEQAVLVNGEARGVVRLEPVVFPLGGGVGAREAAHAVAGAFRFTTMDGVQLQLGEQGMSMVLQNSLDGQLIQVLRDLDVQLQGVPVERLNRLGELMHAQMLENLR